MLFRSEKKRKSTYIYLFLSLFLYLTCIFFPLNVGLYAGVDVLILFYLIFQEFAKETKQDQFSSNDDWGKVLIEG